MAGIRRDAPNPEKKPAATLTVLRDVLAPIPDDLRGFRDRALLLVRRRPAALGAGGHSDY